MPKIKTTEKLALRKERYKEYRNQGYNSYIAKALSQRTKKPTQKDIAVLQRKQEKVKSNRSETIKKRKLVYEKLGYDSKTSTALSKRSLDVSGLEISKKTGKLKRNKKTKNYINVQMEQWKRRDVIDNYTKRTKGIYNDTNYTHHGMLVHDKRYKGENGKIVSIIKNDNRISRDQAYYFLYHMEQSNMSYTQTKKQLMSNKEFEEYDVRKAKRERGKK